MEQRLLTVLWRYKWESRDADAKLAVKKDIHAGKSDIKSKLIVRRTHLVLRGIVLARRGWGELFYAIRDTINETL